MSKCHNMQAIPKFNSKSRPFIITLNEDHNIRVLNLANKESYEIMQVKDIFGYQSEPICSDNSMVIYKNMIITCGAIQTINQYS